MESEETRVVLHDGTVIYCRGEKPHRHRGPAILYPDGREEWWIWGFPLDVEDQRRATSNRL